MTCHGIRPNVRHIGILHLVSSLTISPQSTCHSAPVCEIFIQIGPPSAEKMTSCRFSRWRISAILDFMGPIMGSLKSPCTASYRLSIDTIALNCLVFEKIEFFCNLATDRQTNKQTNKQTNRWTCSMHEAALVVASGGLINGYVCVQIIIIVRWSTTLTVLIGNRQTNKRTNKQTNKQKGIADA